jgi:hypothetical protein
MAVRIDLDDVLVEALLHAAALTIVDANSSALKSVTGQSLRNEEPPPVRQFQLNIGMEVFPAMLGDILTAIEKRIIGEIRHGEREGTIMVPVADGGVVSIRWGCAMSEEEP